MQNKENQLMEYKPNIFLKIRDFFTKIFFRNKKEYAEEIQINIGITDVFKENIIFKECVEKQRLLKLKMKYDKGEISEVDIGLEDMNSLIKLYNEETSILDKDTETRKNNISRMLNELKS